MRGFPIQRQRRLRQNAVLRRMVQEATVAVDDLVYPLFVRHGAGVKDEIGAMPGVYHFSPDTVAVEAEEIARMGIPAVILFGLPAIKDAVGSENFARDGIVQQAIRSIKRAVPEMLVVTDVCMCEYTDHGHCGIIVGEKVDNDRTLEVLAKVALSHAEAGADVIAPSDMMDGRVGVIRAMLDENDFHDTPIMAYSAKYASGFYGPFREAADSTPQFGDRRAYQMDPANGREALIEAELDALEGADIVMVKPALAYLDVIHRLRERFNMPVAAYNVSGEYSMVKAAAAQGWIDEQRVAMEILTGIKRAGADIILTYHAKDVVRWLRGAL